MQLAADTRTKQSHGRIANSVPSHAVYISHDVARKTHFPATKPEHIATMAAQAFGTVAETYAQISANASTACRVLRGPQPHIGFLQYPVTVAKLQNGQYRAVLNIANGPGGTVPLIFMQSGERSTVSASYYQA